MAVDQAEEHGFTLAITPTLVRPEVMRGTGFLNSHADEIHRLREPDDQYLVGTSEVASPACTRTRFSTSQWPAALLRLVLLLPPRGRRRRQGHLRHIIRVHQFDKVESAWFTLSRRTCHASMSTCWRNRRCLPRSRCHTASSTPPPAILLLRRPQVRLRGWVLIPDRYRELTSTSNCTEYQLVVRTSASVWKTAALARSPRQRHAGHHLLAGCHHGRTISRRTAPSRFRRPCVPTWAAREVIEPTKWGGLISSDPLAD